MRHTASNSSLGLGSIWAGRLADRHGLPPVLWCGAVAVFAGFVVDLQTL